MDKPVDKMCITFEQLSKIEIIELTSEDLTRMNERTQYWMNAPIEWFIQYFQGLHGFIPSVIFKYKGMYIVSIDVPYVLAPEKVRMKR